MSVENIFQHSRRLQQEYLARVEAFRKDNPNLAGQFPRYEELDGEALLKEEMIRAQDHLYQLSEHAKAIGRDEISRELHALRVSVCRMKDRL